MTLLAGYDFCSEVNNETLLKLIESKLTIGGVIASPPFQSNVSISQGGISGSVSLIVENLTIDLNSNNKLSLNMTFDNTSIILTFPIKTAICPLDGNIQIIVDLKLIQSGSNKKSLAADFTNATVNIQFSAQSDGVITNAGLPIPLQQFKTFANQAFTTYVQGMGQSNFPLEFTVIPNVDGSISPLQFERLDLKCIGNADRSKQALCLLGIFLKSNDTNGNIAQKTSSAIVPGRDVCVSISPSAFHSLVFCPSVASALGASMAQLPTSCGTANGFNTRGVTVKSLTDHFSQGKIDVNGVITKSGTCYDAKGTFHGAITMSIVSSTLTPKITVDEPSVDVDIPWYCWLAAGIVLGPIGLAVVAILDDVADGIATDIASSALNGALGNNISGVSLAGLGGATFKEVMITVEGITLEGIAPYIYVPSGMARAFWLDGSVLTSSKIQSGSGMVHEEIGLCGIDGDYPYVEYAQQQSAVYTAHSSLLCLPLNIEWEIRIFNSAGLTLVPLAGDNGTVSFETTSDYPLPAPGGSSVTQTVHVTYSKSGDSIILGNQPAEGNYDFSLHAKCVDCAGTSIETGVGISFEGTTADIGGGFKEQYQECMKRIERWIQEHSMRYPKREFPPDLIGPIDLPPEERVAESIRELLAANIPEADAFLVGMKMAYGSSFARGVYFRSSRRPIQSARPATQSIVRLTRAVGITETQIQNAILSMNLANEKAGLAAKKTIH